MKNFLMKIKRSSIIAEHADDIKKRDSAKENFKLYNECNGKWRNSWR